MNRVYKYGAVTVGDDVREQMRLGHEYYNRLVEAENARRRGEWGGDHPPAPPHPKPADESICQCSECREHWRDLRRKLRQAPALDVRPLRKAATEGGLFWGTYLKIEEAFSAAWKKTDALHTVRFRSWHHGGIVAVQIQRSVRPDRCYRITHRRDSPNRIAGSQRANRRRYLEIRIGSDASRRPLWCDPIPFTMHRELSGEVSWVLVTRKQIADREIWSIQFVCRESSPHPDEACRGIVAIDVGWRKLEDGSTRIAFARDDRGVEHELVLPPEWAALTICADEIRGHRDDRLNELKAIDKRFALVKKPRGVARKIAAMKRSDPPEEPGQPVLAWLQRDRHLWQYEVGKRRRSTARRRNDVRVWLRMLRGLYVTAIVKDSGHKRMKEKARERKSLHPAARRNGHHAAPGEVIEEISRVFGRWALEVVVAKDTTASCPDCGHLNQAVPDLFIPCEGCGAVDDRDRISTRNMMLAWEAGLTKKPTARKTTARFAKRHINGEGE